MLKHNATWSGTMLGILFAVLTLAAAGMCSISTPLLCLELLEGKMQDHTAGPGR